MQVVWDSMQTSLQASIRTSIDSVTIVANKFPKITKLYTIKDFGGWDAAQKKFFADGAIFDQIQTGRR
jgi:ABC-type sulfate transport system substrate-binding protein